ncbi:MAG TPA: hypothetical protein VGM90_17985 [Kofleriaceae bacterium]|jgi:hypothetical protein
MDPATLQLRKHSVSASASRVSIAKTPYERMLQVEKLSELGREVMRLANNGRAISTSDR